VLSGHMNGFADWAGSSFFTADIDQLIANLGAA
jgi:hypothetical protein